MIRELQIRIDEGFHMLGAGCCLLPLLAGTWFFFFFLVEHPSFIKLDERAERIGEEGEVVGERHYLPYKFYKIERLLGMASIWCLGAVLTILGALMTTRRKSRPKKIRVVAWWSNLAALLVWGGMAIAL